MLSNVQRAFYDRLDYCLTQDVPHALTIFIIIIICKLFVYYNSLNFFTYFQFIRNFCFYYLMAKCIVTYDLFFCKYILFQYTL